MNDPVYFDKKKIFLDVFSPSFFFFNMMYTDSIITKNCLQSHSFFHWNILFITDSKEYICIKVWKHFLCIDYSTLAFVAVAWCGITQTLCRENSPLSNVFSLRADTVFLKCLCSPSLYRLANILLSWDMYASW